MLSSESLLGTACLVLPGVSGAKQHACVAAKRHQLICAGSHGMTFQHSGQHPLSSEDIAVMVPEGGRGHWWDDQWGISCVYWGTLSVG